jgi:hypothetical protein
MRRYLAVPGLDEKWEEPATPVSVEEWDSLARQIYEDYYNFEERTPEEREENKRRFAWLKEHAPEGRAEGVWLIAPGEGFMGEDVYCVDGQPTHAIHVRCSECGEPSLVGRARGLWCASCAKFVRKG